MSDPTNEILAMVEASADRAVFVHEMSGTRTWWHFGDCFPDVDTCAIPHRADMDAEAN